MIKLNTMKKLVLVSFAVLFSTGLFAQDDGLGLGVVFGEPTGLSAKLWTSENTAIDAVAAWSFINAGFFHLHTDFLIHNFDLIDVSEGSLPVYFGIGAFVTFAADMGLGIRVPFGLDYQFGGAPVDIFAEIAPGLSLLPATRFYVGGGIGVRYFF